MSASNEERDRHRETLLRHARNPQRHGALEAADVKGSCKNPLCGDHVEVQLRFDQQTNKVSDVRILVSGCSIAMSSASMMTDFVTGYDADELNAMIVRATATLSSTANEVWSDEFVSLKPFESLRTNPRKIPCALMAWYALKDSLKGLPKHSTVGVDGADLRALSKNETTL